MVPIVYRIPIVHQARADKKFSSHFNPGHLLVQNMVFAEAMGECLLCVFTDLLTQSGVRKRKERKKMSAGPLMPEE